jgi:hypothetical protein
MIPKDTYLFSSAKQRFFNALLCAAKAATLIDGIERDLAEGRSCVIQIVYTTDLSVLRTKSSNRI